jgi:penicillin-binding protein 2
MRQDIERARSFSRRALVIGGAQLAVFGALGARLWQLQVNEGEHYRLLADENRISERLLVPPRGRILDRAGAELARNQPSYRVRIVADQLRNPQRTLQAMAQLIRLDDQRIEAVLGQLRSVPKFSPVTVRDDLAWGEVARLALQLPEFPGVLLDATSLRDYPAGERLSHIIGYLGPPTEQEQGSDPDPLLRLPEFRVGRNGIEQTYDHQLRGSAGVLRVEVNAVGREVGELDRTEGTSGTDLRLSLDLDLQRYCFDRLSGELAASAVVIEVKTGAVLALASVPSFDPKTFQGGLTQSVWAELRDNPRTPLVNKCIRGQYPPGSTFKMMTALAGLAAGVDPTARVRCTGSMWLGNAKFHCWKEHGHGAVDMVQALERSCDVFYYDLARRIGVDRIAETAAKFGLGQRLGIDLPGELPGLIPTRAWKRRHLNQPWHQGETLVNGIGQGFVLATPLQLATMTARLCNGGRAVIPSFVRDPSAPEPQPIDIPPEHLRVVLRGMRDVIHGGAGTAKAAQLRIAGVEMGGKTGTSQVRRISAADRIDNRYKRKVLTWRERDHALFVCFAPYPDARYAVSVIVEHGEGGSRAAAPIARDIMERTLQLAPAATTAAAGQDNQDG